jgi:hypothetical protein
MNEFEKVTGKSREKLENEKIRAEPLNSNALI